MTLQADVRDADSRGAGSPRSQTESGSIRRGRIRFPLHDERHRELCSGGLCKKCGLPGRSAFHRMRWPLVSVAMVSAYSGDPSKVAAPVCTWEDIATAVFEGHYSGRTSISPHRGRV